MSTNGTERPRSVQVELAGQRVRLRTDVASPRLDALVAQINAEATAAAAGRRSPPPATALVAVVALRLADALDRERRAAQKLRAEVRARARRILEDLDSIAPRGARSA